MDAFTQLIEQARRGEALRQQIRDLDLQQPGAFTTFCCSTFGEALFQSAAWVATVQPHVWYPKRWTVRITLLDGSVYLLTYAWNGPDYPCWEVMSVSHECQANHLFQVACPVVMLQWLVLAIDELQGHGPWPQSAGWSDEIPRPR